MKMDKIIEKIKKIPAKTYISMVMVLIVIINYVLTALDRPLINIGEEEITYAVNTVLNIVLICYTAWKNNSTSDKAILADDVLYLLRDGVISKEELEEFIAKHKVETPEATEEAKKEVTEETVETTEEVKPETVKTTETTETTEETK